MNRLMSSSKLFLFSKEFNSFKLRCETVIVVVLCYSHQASYLLYVRAKLTAAFTCSSLPQFLFSDVVVFSDLNKKLGGSDRFGEKKNSDRWIWRKIHGSTYLAKKKARISGFAYPLFNPLTQLPVCYCKG